MMFRFLMQMQCWHHLPGKMFRENPGCYEEVLNLLSRTCELPADRMAYLGATSLANKAVATQRKSPKRNREVRLKIREEKPADGGALLRMMSVREGRRRTINSSNGKHLQRAHEGSLSFTGPISLSSFYSIHPCRRSIHLYLGDSSV